MGEKPELTEEDRQILALSDEEIRARTSVFSFDLKQAKDRLSAGDKWQQLLQAHLYFDHVITRTLTDGLVLPDEINLARMAFSPKLNLAVAMGLLTKDIASPIEFINSLRNKIAHDLTFEITEQDIRNLSNSTPKALRDAMAARRKPGPLQFYDLLVVLLLATETERREVACKRMYERRARLRLRASLDEYDRGIAALNAV